MKNNLLLPFYLRFALFVFFFSSFYPPSVSAQKIIATTQEPMMLLRVGVGAHQILGNGPMGGNLSFNCEDPIGKHLSWTANFDVLVNPLNVVLPPDVSGTYQIRFVLQPDFRYYPFTVLRRFYIGTGLGIVAGHGKVYGKLPNGKPQLSIFGEALTDLKVGWQGKLLDKYVWNLYASSGLLFPLNGDKTLTQFRIGSQLGLRRYMR